MTKNTNANNAGIQTFGTNVSNLSIIVTGVVLPTTGVLRSYVDSIEVAKIAGKKHFNLIRSIDKFYQQLRTTKGIDTEDYFMEIDTPRGGAGYFITELGCAFLAENLKSVDYVKLFNEILVKHFLQRKSEIKEEFEATPAEFAKFQADYYAEAEKYKLRKVEAVQEAYTTLLEYFVADDITKALNMLQATDEAI